MIAVYLAGVVVSFLAGALCMLMRINATRKTEVLFFPDSILPCYSFQKQMLGDRGFRCLRPRCEYAHINQEFTSLMRIVAYLSKAKRRIDLCVYDFTEYRLAEFLIALHQRGIKVKIITDAHKDRQPGKNDSGDQNKGRNNQIPKLQEAGIQVKQNKSPEGDRTSMHNKFVLIDSKHLIMGSFNWTFNAVKWNHEAVISTNDSKVVKKFVRKFQEIWVACENREVPIIHIR